MTITHAILIIAIPIIVGGIIIWLVFRNINRKYCALFRKLVIVARENPDDLAKLMTKSDAKERQEIVKELASFDEIKKVDVLRAGKQKTQLRLTAKSQDRVRFWNISLVNNQDGWGISDFFELGE